ncbi:IS66 family insertion sequence element accessory protein TnpA [Arcticibacter tournemirensis]|uniref:Uncharacterized protein n=1 Tax=Arcticibacter tournemirensis TaxID=699437 RepID=A0A4Q0MCL4_9SPHI|nr:hypothetical protein [Arcticibacter tournemirensis]RXF70536.1 hypothetical protein EKH83_07790 [Arcticibacter tournemirensis]
MDQRERMKAEVERWRQSRLSQKEFCKELGMKAGTFAYWASRSKESEKKIYTAGSVSTPFFKQRRMDFSNLHYCSVI